MRRSQRATLPLALAATLLLLGAGRDARAQSTEILYTTCANAHLENCRCPDDPYGAIEKRLPEVERRRELGPVLLIDSGDFFPAMVDSVRAVAMVRAYELLAYDAITLGDQELMHGQELLGQLVDRLPVVSANLVDAASGEPVAPLSRTVERGGSSYYITGITHPEAFRFIDPELLSHVRALDPDSALAPVLADAPEGATVIVLSHSGTQRDEQQAPGWHGVDLVLAGHDQSRIDGVRMLGELPLLSAGGNARYLGVARFAGPRLRAELLPLRPAMPDDPRIVELVMEVKRARHAAGH